MLYYVKLATELDETVFNFVYLHTLASFCTEFLSYMLYYPHI